MWCSDHDGRLIFTNQKFKVKTGKLKKKKKKQPFGDYMDTAKNNEAQEDVHSRSDKDWAILLTGKFPYIIWANRKVDRVWKSESMKASKKENLKFQLAVKKGKKRRAQTDLGDQMGRDSWSEEVKKP